MVNTKSNVGEEEVSACVEDGVADGLELFVTRDGLREENSERRVFLTGGDGKDDVAVRIEGDQRVSEDASLFGGRMGRNIAIVGECAARRDDVGNHACQCMGVGHGVVLVDMFGDAEELGTTRWIVTTSNGARGGEADGREEAIGIPDT